MDFIFSGVGIGRRVNSPAWAAALSIALTCCHASVLRAQGSGSVTVTAGAGSIYPAVPCGQAPVTAVLQAVATPPATLYSCPLQGPIWSWTVVSVQYSTDNISWGPSPGGDSQSINHPDANFAASAFTGTFVQTGYWKITVQATAGFTDLPCNDTWSGSGTGVISVYMPQGQANSVTVSASAGTPSTSSACLNSEVDTPLSASVSNPPSGGTVAWSWTVTNVQYSSDGVNWGASPGGDSQWILENPSTSSASLGAMFPVAGHWRVTAQATAVFTDSQCNSWTGSATTTVTLQSGGGGQTNSLTVQASAGSAAPSPVCINSTATASLSATVSNPPSSGSYTDGPNWSWTVTAVKYSADGVNWTSSPGGDSEWILLPDPTSSSATFNGTFPQSGYWQVTVQATAQYDDYPCSDLWTGSGTATVTVNVNGGGQNNSLTVSASASAPTPNPVCIYNSATSNLSASVSNPPSGSNISAANWSWSITKVQFSTDNVHWSASPGGDSESINQPDPTSASATLTASFPQAGYWQVTLQASVTYNDSPCSDTWSGSGTATVTFQSTAGTSHPLTVSASASGPTPNPFCGTCQPTVSLSASVSNPPSGPGIAGPIWSWTVQSVQYRASQSDPWQTASGYSLSITQQTQSSATATASGSFSEPGYYSVTLQATIEYNDAALSTWFFLL